jgi:hypothetical protein
MEKATKRWVLVLATVACLLGLGPASANGSTPTCAPYQGFPSEPPANACPPDYCLDSRGISYPGECPSGSSGLAVVVFILVVPIFWGLPYVLIRRAASRRGLDPDEISGAWPLFGWAGVTYKLFKSIPTLEEQEARARPDTDVAGMMDRAAHRIAAQKQIRTQGRNRRV